VTGWVTLVSSSLALIVVLWRANNKPVLDRLTSLEQKFDGEIKRMEQRLNEHEEERTEREAEIIGQMTDKLNGFGARVADNKESVTFLSSQQVALAERMSRSEMDRMNINSRLSEVRATTDNLAKALPDVELRLTKAVSDQTATLLKEIPLIVQQAVASYVALQNQQHNHPPKR
jgi:chromosome segregation ATPase